jgi:iron(III) transport system permease protein
MYQDVIGLLDFGKGSVIGLVLLVPALIAFIADFMNRDRGNASYVIKPFPVTRKRARDGFACAFCSLVSAAVLLPVVAFGILSFIKKYPVNLSLTLDNVRHAMNLQLGQYLFNAIEIALLVSVLGTVLALAAGYLVARMPSRSTRLLHLLSITTIAVPGIVLGLAYILFFKGSFLYGTLAILVLVNLAHFFASPYLMSYNAFSKVNENLESVGATLGLGRPRVLLGVILIGMGPAITDMFAYFFVNSMITISAVSFLATVSTKPVSLMIATFEANMVLECAAFVSLLILGVNIIVKCIAARMKRIITTESRRTTHGD